MEETYNEYLWEKLNEVFSKKEAELFFEESEKPRPTTIRINTLLKRRKELINMLSARGVDLEKLEWTDVGAVVFKSNVPLGATPEYLAGYYCLQGAASMLPVLNLDVEENMKVVDMCAAPGGKSAHIAALLNNTGMLYSNDVNSDRVVSLKSNLQRMGVKNAIILNKDARTLNFEKMDRVLLDAPCSGTGVISKDPSIKINRNRKEIMTIVLLQKELIRKGFEMLKVGGIMVYSTCSVLPAENESVVDYLLKKYPNAKILPCSVDVGRNGFPSFRGSTYHGTLESARRIYPHVHNMDGFFYVKITKTH